MNEECSDSESYETANGRSWEGDGIGYGYGSASGCQEGE
jgi:hypothetical protein